MATEVIEPLRSSTPAQAAGSTSAAHQLALGIAVVEGVLVASRTIISRWIAIVVAVPLLAATFCGRNHGPTRLARSRGSPRVSQAIVVLVAAARLRPQPLAIVVLGCSRSSRSSPALRRDRRV